MLTEEQKQRIAEQKRLAFERQLAKRQRTDIVQARHVQEVTAELPQPEVFETSAAPAAVETSDRHGQEIIAELPTPEVVESSAIPVVVETSDVSGVVGPDITDEQKQRLVVKKSLALEQKRLLGDQKIRIVEQKILALASQDASEVAGAEITEKQKQRIAKQQKLALEQKRLLEEQKQHIAEQKILALERRQLEKRQCTETVLDSQMQDSVGNAQAPKVSETPQAPEAAVTSDAPETARNCQNGEPEAAIEASTSEESTIIPETPPNPTTKNDSGAAQRGKNETPAKANGAPKKQKQAANPSKTPPAQDEEEKQEGEENQDKQTKKRKAGRPKTVEKNTADVEQNQPEGSPTTPPVRDEEETHEKSSKKRRAKAVKETIAEPQVLVPNGFGGLVPHQEPAKERKGRGPRRELNENTAEEEMAIHRKINDLAEATSQEMDDFAAVRYGFYNFMDGTIAVSSANGYLNFVHKSFERDARSYAAMASPEYKALIAKTNADRRHNHITSAGVAKFTKFYFAVLEENGNCFKVDPAWVEATRPKVARTSVFSLLGAKAGAKPEVKPAVNPGAGLETMPLLASDSTAELCVVAGKVSIIDPIMLTRIEKPVRGIRCEHPGIFDRGIYVEFNQLREKRKNSNKLKDLWLCPHCAKPTPEHCLVDLKPFAEFIASLDEESEIEHVIVEKDGTLSLPK